MGSIGGSRAKQSANAQQSSQSTGWTESGSASTGQTSQDVWGAQSPALQQLFGAAQGLLGGGAGAPQVEQAQQAWQSALSPGTNPYFSQSMQAAIDQATRGFTQGVLPQLADQGVAVGQLGTPRHQLAVGQAAGQFGQDLAGMVTHGYAQQYGADQQMRMQALGMAPQMAALNFSPLQAAAGVIGGPTVLGQGSQQSASFGRGAQQSTSQGTSASSGNSRSFSLGIGQK
jgi:hypothetical protein